MNKDHFAKSFGFMDYEEMFDNTTTVFQDNVAWCVSKLPQGKFLTWNDAEIADDRVEVFFSREEAEDYLNILRNRSKMEENIKH